LKELEDFGIKFTEKEVPYLGYNPLNTWRENNTNRFSHLEELVLEF
jgi:hypothetical protein